MIYNDGCNAVLIFGGGYAATTFHWSTLDLLAYGVILSVFATYGGVFGGWIDHRFGSRNGLLIAVGGTMVGSRAVAVDAAGHDLVLHPLRCDVCRRCTACRSSRRWPEIIYVIIVIIIAIFITASYANSRTMMARIAPTEKMAEFFGLYALSGTATAFLAPFVVARFTEFSHSNARRARLDLDPARHRRASACCSSRTSAPKSWIERDGAATTTCCIVGGGPAGMMLGFLLGAGRRRRHRAREARAISSAIFAATRSIPRRSRIFTSSGCSTNSLKLPHQELRHIEAQIGDETFAVADFSHLPTRCKFVAFMPQWDFLDFLAARGTQAQDLPLMMETEGDRSPRAKASASPACGRARPDGDDRDQGAAHRRRRRAAFDARARSRGSRSWISARRWTCCGCASPNSRGRDAKASAARCRGG